MIDGRAVLMEYFKFKTEHNRGKGQDIQEENLEKKIWNTFRVRVKQRNSPDLFKTKFTDTLKQITLHLI